MLTETKRTDLFCEYYAKWITVYKKGDVYKRQAYQRLESYRLLAAVHPYGAPAHWFLYCCRQC